MAGCERCDDSSSPEQSNFYQRFRTQFRILCLLVRLYKLWARAAYDRVGGSKRLHII